MVDPQVKEYVELALTIFGAVAFVAGLVFAILRIGWKIFKEKDNELKATKKALKASEDARERAEMVELRQSFHEVRNTIIVFKRQVVSALRKLNNASEETRDIAQDNQNALEAMLINNQSKFQIVADHLKDINERMESVEEGSAVIVKEISLARGLPPKEEKKAKLENLGKDLFILRGDKKKKE